MACMSKSNTVHCSLGGFSHTRLETGQEDPVAAVRCGHQAAYSGFGCAQLLASGELPLHSPRVLRDSTQTGYLRVWNCQGYCSQVNDTEIPSSTESCSRVRTALWFPAAKNVGAELNLRSETHWTKYREEVRTFLFIVGV